MKRMPRTLSKWRRRLERGEDEESKKAQKSARWMKDVKKHTKKLVARNTLPDTK